MTRKHFNKNLIMSAEEEETFQLSNVCWICNKLFDVTDEKVRDYCHITGKCRGAARFNMSKNVPVTFHNLKGYDSHLIFTELSKCSVKISVISDG